MKRVLVLGAGFGGLELSTSLSEAFGDAIDVVLIDQSDHFVFGFSKLDVMFGRTVPDAVRHYYRELVKPGVRFIQTTIRSIDPTTRSVETDDGHFNGDVMVVALGADLDIAATPGLVEVGHEFYTVAGAFGLRDVLANFSGGHVVVGVTSTPFKCPPAPSETALMMHDFLVERGLRGQSRISLVSPLPVPIPPSPAASEALLAAFAEREIGWFPGRSFESWIQRRRPRDSPTVQIYRLICFSAFRPTEFQRLWPNRGWRSTDGSPSIPSRSRRRFRACSPSATSPVWARPRQACSPNDRHPSRPSTSSRSFAGVRRPQRTTASDSVISSSVTTKSPASK